MQPSPRTTVDTMVTASARRLLLSTVESSKDTTGTPAAQPAYLDRAVPGKLISEKLVKLLPLSVCLQSGSVAGPGPLRSVLANLRGKVLAVPRGSSPLLSMEESSVGFTICNGACSDFR